MITIVVIVIILVVVWIILVVVWIILVVVWNAKVINHPFLICAKANGAPSGAIVLLNPNPFPNYLKSKAST